MASMLENILRRHYTRFNHPPAEGDPDYVIMDIAWLVNYWPKDGFFERFSLMHLLEIVTSVNMHEDYDPVVWDSIGDMLTEGEEKTFDFQATSFLIESVIELFYQELHHLTLQSESTYLFFKWADKDAIILKRE